MSWPLSTILMMIAIYWMLLIGRMLLLYSEPINVGVVSGLQELAGIFIKRGSLKELVFWKN